MNKTKLELDLLSGNVTVLGPDDICAEFRIDEEGRKTAKFSIESDIWLTLEEFLKLRKEKGAVLEKKQVVSNGERLDTEKSKRFWEMIDKNLHLV